MISSIDLHMHSFYSDDGEFSPEELVEKCRKQGIKTMAIADHNCVRANRAGRLAALSAGITYIPAIEIDCIFQEIPLHVLGYGIDSESPDFDKIEENISVQAEYASLEMLKSVQKLGFVIERSEMELLSRDRYWKNRWNGEMFAELLLGSPRYLEHSLLQPYRLGGSRADNPYVNFYWDYFSHGKPCCFPMKYPSLKDTLDIIHKNGGKAVLAHPGVNLKDREEAFQQLLWEGIDGIEAFSSYHSPSQAEYYHRNAMDHDLFVTFGSDFHGKTKPSVRLGQHGGLENEWGACPF